MNTYVTTPAPKPAINMSKTGEIVTLAILGVGVVGFLNLANRMMDQVTGPVKKSKFQFWLR